MSKLTERDTKWGGGGKSFKIKPVVATRISDYA